MPRTTNRNDGETLREKLDAARAGESRQLHTPPPDRSPMSPAMIVVLVLILVAAIAMAAAFPWLVEQPQQTFLPLFSGAAILLIVFSAVFAFSYDRRTDEWQKAAARFSSQWGFWAGTALAMLLLFPIGVWMRSWAPGPYLDYVRVGFVFGLMAVMITQVLCVALLYAAWTLWMSRSPRGFDEEQD